ncbi:MAG: 1-acyl-sn-glycerol-3-phosphate acyltransferase [Candidatus Woesearchaeota archaeon]
MDVFGSELEKSNDDIGQKVLNAPDVRKTIARIVSYNGRHLESVPEAVGDAEVERLNDKARKYCEAMAGTIEPSMLAKGTEIAKDFVGRTFSGIAVRGLEQLVDENATVADILNRGSVVIIADHPSYANIPVLKVVYSQLGLENRMYFIAGKNVVNAENPTTRAWLKPLVTGSGAIFIERQLPTGREDGVLYASVLDAILAELLSKKSLITIFRGKGRDKGDKTEALNSIMTRAFLNNAEYIVPLAQSHYIIPDDHQLATHEHGRGGSSFEAMFAVEGTEGGPVYISFGVPIRASPYRGASKKELTAVEQEITYRISRLVTLTPTYVLASAVKSSGMENFTIGQILSPVNDILVHAKENNLCIAPDLNGTSDLQESVYNAAEALVRRGALSRLGTQYDGNRNEQKAMLGFYAAKIEGALNGKKPAI